MNNCLKQIIHRQREDAEIIPIFSEPGSIIGHTGRLPNGWFYASKFEHREVPRIWGNFRETFSSREKATEAVINAFKLPAVRN